MTPMSIGIKASQTEPCMNPSIKLIRRFCGLVQSIIKIQATRQTIIREKKIQSLLFDVLARRSFIVKINAACANIADGYVLIAVQNV